MPRHDAVILTLTLRYPDVYPNALPDFAFESVEGELTQDEEEALLTGMREQVRPPRRRVAHVSLANPRARADRASKTSGWQ